MPNHPNHDSATQRLRRDLCEMGCEPTVEEAGAFLEEVYNEVRKPVLNEPVTGDEVPPRWSEKNTNRSEA